MRGKIKRIAIAINIAILLALFFTYESGALRSLSNGLYDFNMKETADHQPHDRIIVVSIDNESLDALGQFPWDRTVYAAFLDTINQPGNEPKAIAFDILFNDESDPDSDQAFAEALERHPNVILPTIGITEGEISNSTIVRRDQWIKAYSMDSPLPLLAEHAHLAHINRTVEEDGVIRKNWLKLESPDGVVYNSLAYEAVKMYGADLGKYDNYTRPGKAVARNTIDIDFNLTEKDIVTIPFISVLNGDLVDSDYLKDAVVFVGFTAAGLSSDDRQDTGITPIERNVNLVYVHANIADQLLKGYKISFSPVWLEILLIALLYGLFIWLPWRLKNIYSILIFFGTIAAVLGAQYYYFQTTKTYFAVVYALLATVVTYLANVSLKSYLDSAQKSFVTRQFGRYISPDLVKEIVSQDIDIKLGGDLKLITVLFLDIRGFTPLSEKLTPPELVDTLNTMFNMITQTTLNNRGTIDKFIGDAAMILFNAPLDVEEHERLAVKTAYEIQQGMNVIREQIREKYGCEVNVGIGINTGNVVVGNIGSYLRVDYTAIGDNVNIAARIESSTKPGQIMVSEAVYEKTKEHFIFEDAGEKMFKGKSLPIRIYEVVGIAGEDRLKATS